MAQKYGFFNSENGDRRYDTSDIARFLSKFFTNGIFNNSLQVSANDNMTVSVAIGNANINGYGYENTETLVLDIDESDSELGRIDSVIVRLDLTNRQITTMILQGSYASTPSQPSITRTGTIYDLRLANISIPAETTRITTDMITDTRFGADCGNVTQAVLELSTDEIFKQYEAWFTEWFANLEDQLDDNQAGHLQNQINDIRISLGLYSDTYDKLTKELQEQITENKDDINLINENLSKLTNELLIFDGSVSSGTKITIDKTWEQLGRFKELKIVIMEESMNGTSSVIFPYNALSNGDNLYSGRLNTNAFSLSSIDSKGSYSLTLIPYNKIGVNSISFNVSQDRKIIKIYVVY